MNMNAISLNIPIVLRAKEFKKGKVTKYLYLFFTLSIVFLSVFYIFQTNVEISEKYAFIGYEKELSDLIQKKESLSILMANSASFNTIVNTIENSEKGFIKTEKINYLKISDKSIVSI